VEYVKRAGNGWDIASEGVFVREVTTDADGEKEEPSDLADTALLVSAVVFRFDLFSLTRAVRDP
jgi:hypothetical protein